MAKRASTRVKPGVGRQVGDGGELPLDVRQRIEAENQETTPERLAELLTSKYLGVRKTAAKNPHLSHADMTRIAKSGEIALRRALAQNPGLFGALQKYLLKDSAVSVQLALAGNYHILTETLAALVAHTDSKVRAEVARRVAGLSRELQESLMLSAYPGNLENQDLRVHLAGNTGMAVELLDQLGADTNPLVRVTVAGNPKTGPGTLLRLTGDSNPGVGTAAAKNPHTPVAGLGLVLDRANCWLALADNPALPAEMAVYLAQRAGRVDVWKKILYHPNLPEREQLRLGVEKWFGEWYGYDDWRQCASPRVAKWMAEMKGGVEVGAAPSFRSQAGLVSCDWEEVRLEVGFPHPEETAAEVLFGKKVTSDNLYGWWEPAMGDKWLCLITEYSEAPLVGMVPGDYAAMGKSQLWTTAPSIKDKTRIFLHGDWEISEGEQGLVASNWARAAERVKEFPALPNFRRTYGLGEQTHACRGVLLLESRLWGLWVDKSGQEVGWTNLESETDLTGVPPPAFFLFQGAGTTRWGEFEKTVRRAGFGRGL